MKKYLLIILLLPFLFSCAVHDRTVQPRITHVLAINSHGTQVTVPIETIILRNDPYFYTNWQFFWGNRWYWGYNWYNHVYDPYWRPILNRYYVNYTPNLRSYTFGRRNSGFTSTRQPVSPRRVDNIRSVSRRNVGNRVYRPVNNRIATRNSSITTRRNVNNRPVVRQNTGNSVRQGVRVNTPVNRSQNTQTRVNGTLRRN